MFQKTNKNRKIVLRSIRQRPPHFLWRNLLRYYDERTILFISWTCFVLYVNEFESLLFSPSLFKSRNWSFQNCSFLPSFSVTHTTPVVLVSISTSFYLLLIINLNHSYSFLILVIFTFTSKLEFTTCNCVNQLSVISHSLAKTKLHFSSIGCRPVFLRLLRTSTPLSLCWILTVLFFSIL